MNRPLACATWKMVWPSVAVQWALSMRSEISRGTARHSSAMRDSVMRGFANVAAQAAARLVHRLLGPERGDGFIECPGAHGGGQEMRMVPARRHGRRRRNLLVVERRHERVETILARQAAIDALRRFLAEAHGLRHVRRAGHEVP